ncbi:MAG: TIGR00730 family Rossman fold protein [Gammaproteobacteria bacterium]|nr:TIGR00730 family Rossman fold protein [Gammaproteobacteria bacterium]
MKRLCVFCGANSGHDPRYMKAAAALGRSIAQAGLGLVYGGASIGLMGAVADAALAEGGEVIGVIPQTLVAREVAHHGLSDLRIVTSMHERKALIADLSDGFIALPGGVGTLEELFEVWTWSHLGLHRKPCGLLDVAGFYSGLGRFIDHVQQEGFLRDGVRDMLLMAENPTQMIAAMRAYVAPTTMALINSRQS